MAGGLHTLILVVLLYCKQHDIAMGTALECTVGQSQGNTLDGHHNYTMYMQQPTCNWHITQYKFPVIIIIRVFPREFPLYKFPVIIIIRVFPREFPFKQMDFSCNML